MTNIPATVIDRIPATHLGNSSIGPGWTDLVQRLDNSLNVIREDYVVLQVKEKFGSLRYYTDFVGTDSDAAKIIRAAEAESLTICEECGGAGELQTGGWWITMCDTCYTRRNETRSARWKEYLASEPDV